jgi:hypothetical protein
MCNASEKRRAETIGAADVGSRNEFMNWSKLSPCTISSAVTVEFIFYYLASCVRTMRTD